MTNALNSVRDLADHLIALENRGLGHKISDLKLAKIVCAKLQVPLTRFAGPVGFAALLSRALALASQDNPIWKTVMVTADGGLSVPDMDNVSTSTSTSTSTLATNFTPTSGLLIAHLLGLIETFLGEQLMLTLLCDAWPNESLDKAAFAKQVES